jgi:hypothetical protein
MSSREIEEPDTNEVAGFIAKTFEILNVVLALLRTMSFPR